MLFFTLSASRNPIYVQLLCYFSYDVFNIITSCHFYNDDKLKRTTHVGLTKYKIMQDLAWFWKIYRMRHLIGLGGVYMIGVLAKLKLCIKYNCALKFINDYIFQCLSSTFYNTNLSYICFQLFLGESIKKKMIIILIFSNPNIVIENLRLY